MYSAHTRHFSGKKGSALNEITVEAVTANLETVTDFVNDVLASAGCPLRTQMQIDIAIDEIFSNIVRYAYSPLTGPATVRVNADAHEACIVFSDRGKPFDPLQGSDPDVTQSAEDRPIGGLGIFLVKKTMDDMRYAWRDGCNELTLVKRY